MDEQLHKYEQVSVGVWRFSVPGGWIYSFASGSLSVPDAKVFVPTPVESAK